MSVEENKALIRQVYDYCNKRELEAYFALFAPGYIFHSVDGDLPLEQAIQHEREWFVAELSFVNKRETGKTTDTLSDANAIYFPLGDAESIFGVIGVRINDSLDSESKELEFLRTFIIDITLFLERHLTHSIPYA